jgi:hypothetical protein
MTANGGATASVVRQPTSRWLRSMEKWMRRLDQKEMKHHG